jgi:hypothetical protein
MYALGCLLLEMCVCVFFVVAGDAVVGSRNISMVELAGSFGLSAKFTGSGGAMLCLRADGINEWSACRQGKILLC